jgi:tripartite-type tricarboxylate transporter receptor subunit TctC
MRCIPVFVLLSIALTAAGSAWPQSAAPAGGQAFPSRPIRLVVASPAGSSPDLIARALARQAENYLGQNVIVDNRAGANGRPRAVNRVPACGMRTSASRDARRRIYRGHSIRLRGRIP